MPLNKSGLVVGWLTDRDSRKRQQLLTVVTNFRPIGHRFDPNVRNSIFIITYQPHPSSLAS